MTTTIAAIHVKAEGLPLVPLNMVVDTLRAVHPAAVARSLIRALVATEPAKIDFCLNAH